ncbi:MAG TPA: hypothetical protein DIT07_00965 [Sphingobacteriaceae bacterium]|nr:hypothetical protein [Sphingobacteriaceae bacterium]
MALKEIVDQLLKEENRSLSWLATEMDKTFEGLKLSLTKGSIKYNDLKQMALILKVPPARFFEDKVIQQKLSESLIGEDLPYYAGLKNDLNSCKELVSTLKSQVKDKEKIIELLSADKN